MTEQIVILDFGSQYTQVIARRVRECNVYSVILRYDTPAEEIPAPAVAEAEDDLASTIARRLDRGVRRSWEIHATSSLRDDSTARS